MTPQQQMIEQQMKMQRDKEMKQQQLEMEKKMTQQQLLQYKIKQAKQHFPRNLCLNATRTIAKFC